MLAISSMTFIAQAGHHGNAYTVQIATYKNLPTNFLTSAEAFGDVHTSQTGELTRVSVGSFNSRSEAQALLSRIKQAGYDDAFINQLGTSNAANRSHSSSSSQDSFQANPSSEMAKFRNLPEAEKDRAVFVDGKLHLKDGNQFIPVP